MIEQTICDVQLLLGNEAIALGAYHAGVRVATGYPGTPSTKRWNTWRVSPRQRSLLTGLRTKKWRWM